MKFAVIISILLLVFAFIFPIFFSLGDPVNEPETSAAPSSPADAPPSETPALQTPGEISISENAGSADASVSVSVLLGGAVTEITLKDYLIGVVAAEMPVTFQDEALKAQAVAARTYTMYKMLVSPSENHPEADVCGDPACCKAYSSPEKLREKWGDDFDMNIKKITAAVESTDGECLIYEDKPALAVFHSSSNGETEASGNVWSASLPYLKSVETPENAETVPNFVTYVTVSLSDFTETVLSACPQADFSGDVQDWIASPEYTESGRLSQVIIGGVPVSGTQLRELFALRSSAVSIETDGEYINFTVTGYGHGVGMSQYGANVMAGGGSLYTDILSWYYSGTSLGSISAFF